MNIVSYVIKNRGVTLDHKGGIVSCNSGYYVSIAALDKIAIRELTQEKIEKELGIFNEIYGLNDGVYLGIWLDGKDCYFDVSVNIGSKFHAIAIGKRFNQLAIWDCNQGVEVRI